MAGPLTVDEVTSTNRVRWNDGEATTLSMAVMLTSMDSRVKPGKATGHRRMAMGTTSGEKRAVMARAAAGRTGKGMRIATMASDSQGSQCPVMQMNRHRGIVQNQTRQEM